MKKNNLNKALEKLVVEKLLKEFKNISSEPNLYTFFNKYMTIGEKESFFRRMAVIILLNENTKYRDIKKMIGISGNTISNVRDILAGKGYAKNFNKKRKYASLNNHKKVFEIKGRVRYKGTSGIFDPFSALG